MINTLTLIPEDLGRLYDPPRSLYYVGRPPEEWLARPRLAIIGSRRPTAYGRQITLQLARQLAEQGVVIISGLALGIDCLAHQGALEGHGLTVAVLPSPLNDIVPHTNSRIARQIVEQGGTLLSEYAEGAAWGKHTYIARNRIIAGLAGAVLITEAAARSGSLYTADFAMQLGRPVFVVPGNITSPNSAGTNKLLFDGALPVTQYRDVLEAMGWPERQAGQQSLLAALNASEGTICGLLAAGITGGDELLGKSGLSVSQFGQAITMLEINGHIRSLGGNRWGLC